MVVLCQFGLPNGTRPCVVEVDWKNSWRADWNADGWFNFLMMGKDGLNICLMLLVPPWSVMARRRYLTLIEL